ncbi:hypothetical protein AHAS_Ahas01G0234700 [Arachis hypogaea]
MTITLQDVAYQLGLKIDDTGVVPSPEDRQPQTKWTVKLTWFHNTVCEELEQDATEERLMRWLPLLEDLDACGRLSWGDTIAYDYLNFVVHLCSVNSHRTFTCQSSGQLPEEGKVRDGGEAGGEADAAEVVGGEVPRQRDPVSPPSHRADDAGQTVGSLHRDST